MVLSKVISHIRGPEHPALGAEAGTMELEVIEANLPQKGAGKYRVKVEVDGQRRGKTGVKHASDSPVWNHKFHLMVCIHRHACLRAPPPPLLSFFSNSLAEICARFC